MICRHCNRKKASRPRGLCWSCYYTPGVRERYPSQSVYGKWADGGLHDPTEAELEAVIVEQMKHLPAWWNKENA